MIKNPLPTLSPGDFVPPFRLPDQNGKMRELQNYGGKRTAIFFLPMDDAFLTAFFQALRAEEAQLGALNFHRIYVLHATPEALSARCEQLGISSLLFADASGALHRAFGVGEGRAAAFLLNENLRILQQHMPSEPGALLAVIMNAVGALKPPPKLLFDGTIPHAPVVVIPEAITPELQAEVLEYWRQGKQYTGTIGEGQTAKVSAGKRRTDVDLRDHALIAKVDAEIAQRVLPELRKVACVDIAYRERYKVGRYGAEDQGWYNQHRDTGVRSLAYRRYSMSVGLSSQYEGGVLQFPEYGDCGYKLTARSALLFPSTLLHGVTPVTAGERFIMVSFMHGEAEERARQEVSGKPGSGDLPLFSETRHPGVEESDAFYTLSLKRN